MPSRPHLSSPDPARPTLVLGSTSPYRRELLARLHLPFEVVAPQVDETPAPGEAPAALAQRLALAKAQAVAAALAKKQGHGQGTAPDVVVIGSDQVADLHGQPLGKPGHHEAAVAQWRAMRGHTVLFHTAVAVLRPARGFEGQTLSTVRVQMRSAADLSDADIEHYLRTEQPYDCAGSAKAEGLGIALLDGIESDDPTALIGLPLIALSRLLRQAGLDPLKAGAAGAVSAPPSPR